MAEILVCDDDKDIVEAIEIYLTQEGHHILKAYDGEQAIRVLKNNPVDLLIIDVMMPKLDGIRANQIYESIWEEEAIAADNTVAVHIRHIREKIEINPKEPRYLKVVWGLGYKVEKI